jgi:serine/threonine protein kinase/tetratricopeptide (TPR) repeat protein
LELIERLKPAPGDAAGPSDATGPGVEPAVAIGDRLRRLGDYTILREIGRGGMGVVYEALDERRDTVVALKTVRRGDSAAILRFKQEFRALADVSYPNLVTLHELTADGLSWFFTMELVEGVDFLTFIRSGADRPASEATVHLGLPIPSLGRAGMPATVVSTETEASQPQPMGAGAGEPGDRGASLDPEALARLRHVLRQLAEGIAVLHEADRLHRDLKPSNVIVTRHGRAVILEFGLAAELGPSGPHQSPLPYVLGTYRYISPEQAAGRPVSPASDWYSFGSMLYEALTGRPPFLGHPFEVLRAEQQSEPPAPCALVPGLPDDLNALCFELLRRDPEGRPAGGEVLRRLGSTTGAPELPVPLPVPSQRAAPLVGRARELECLGAGYADVCRGRTVAVYIHGPSGIGKTALVRRFLEEQAGRGKALILASRCYEQESVPYKALDGVVDALGRYLKGLPLAEALALLPRDIRSLVRVFPALGQAEAVATAPRPAAEVPDPQELRRRAFGALRELLARLGDRRPLVLSIDDLQWGDTDSAALLLDLLRPPDSPRLLLLGCYRSEDAATSSLLRALLGVQGGAAPGFDGRELALGTLEHPDAEGLAMRLLGRDDEAAHAHAAAIARESGGNPFFIAELVRYLQAETDLLDRVPATNEVALDEVLWWRIGRLPEEARRLLEVVAVSGRPLGQGEASRAAELGGRERTASNILRAGRLIRGLGPPEDDQIEAYHDRIREAVVARIPPAGLAGHHRRLASVLEGSGRADPEVLAVHLQGAGEPLRAGTYYARAAEHAAEALAFDRAAKLYRLALELGAWDEVEAHRLRIGLGDALANAGRGPEAARAYLAATAGSTAAEAFELQRRAALQYLTSGHLDEGLAKLKAVLRSVGISFPRTSRRALFGLVGVRIRLRFRGLRSWSRQADRVRAEDLRRIDACWTAADGLGLIDCVRGAYFQARGLLLAVRAGEPYRLARSWPSRSPISRSGAGGAHAGSSGSSGRPKRSPGDSTTLLRGAASSGRWDSQRICSAGGSGPASSATGSSRSCVPTASARPGKSTW